MEPWVAFLIFVGVLFFVVMIAVIIVFMTRTSTKGTGGKTVLDLAKYGDHQIITVFKPHQDFFTKEWKVATQNKDKVIVREKGSLKRPEHELDREDMMEFFDAESGYHLIINGVSIFNEKLTTENKGLKTEIDKKESVISDQNAYILTLRRHMDKKALEIVDKAENIAVNVNKFSGFSKKT